MSHVANMPYRLSFAAVVSLGVTFALLFLMQLLIASGKTVETKHFRVDNFSFVRVIPDTPPTRIEPTKPPKIFEAPPVTPPTTFDFSDSTKVTINIPPPETVQPVNTIIRNGFVSDGEYLPIVKVAPIYPRRAQIRGTEGFVLIEFTVTKTGAVTHPRVIQSEPSSVFNRAAIAAVLKFKYKPRVVNGVPIEVPGVQNMIRFELTN